jgi:hypothetical protein
MIAVSALQLLLVTIAAWCDRSLSGRDLKARKVATN